MHLNSMNSCLCLLSFEICVNSCNKLVSIFSRRPCFRNTSQASRILSESYNSSASSSPSSPFYTGESSDESLPKPRSDDGKPNAMPILFKVLKNATRNFQPDSILGEGNFGPFLRDGLTSALLMLQSRDLEWPLLSRSGMEMVFKGPSNGW